MYQEPTKFQEFWANACVAITYFMFGWLAEESPVWRLILLPVALVTMTLGLIPAFLFLVLDMIINGEFY